MTYCDSPAQSVVVGVGAGLFGGLAGVALSLDLLGVVLVASVLAVVGELLAHARRGDLPIRSGDPSRRPGDDDREVAYTDPTRR